MKAIPLTMGQIALVDDEDFERLNQWKWTSMWDPKGKYFYATRRERISPKKQKTIYMHQIIIDVPPGMVCDHIDHNPLNNQRNNLRVVTHRQNMQNNSRNCTSNYPGVSWAKDREKWLAQATINGKRTNLGRYEKEEDAYKAYCAALNLIGEGIVCVPVK